MAVLAGVSLLLMCAAAFEHKDREHVRITMRVGHDIVQVFVDCRLAHAYTGQPVDVSALDLGWLDPGDVITLQVRGRLTPGFYDISLKHGSRSDRAIQSGSYGHSLHVANTVIFHRSYTATGRDVGDGGCQSGAGDLLPMAAVAESTFGRWSGEAGLKLELTNDAFSVMPWVFAGIGGAIILGAALIGAGAPGDERRRHLARAGGLANLVLGLLVAIGGRDSALVFDLCCVVGMLSLGAACRWLWHEPHDDRQPAQPDRRDDGSSGRRPEGP